MTEEQKTDSAPYESLLKAIVNKIQVQPFLFIIAIVALIIALVVVGTELVSADYRFTLAIIAALAVIVIIGYFVLEARKLMAATQPVTQPPPPAQPAVTTTDSTTTPLSMQKVTAADGGQVSDASQQNEGVTQQEISATGPGSRVSNVQQVSSSTTVPQRTGRSKGIDAKSHGQLRQVLLDCAPLGERELRSLFVDDRLSPWRNQLPSAENPQARVESLIAFLHGKHNVLGENGLVLFLQVAAERLDETDACRGRLVAMAQQLQRN
jgi:hypothetical protein